VAPEDRKKNVDDFKDYLDEIRKEFRNVEFLQKKILATNMTAEEIELHKSAAQDKYIIV
jgi:hypothetical protein